MSSPYIRSIKHTKRSSLQHRVQRIHIVLPAFNEGHRIGLLLDRIQEVMFDDHLEYRIVFVDDGSTDDTKSIIENYSGNMPILYKKHNRNFGLGCALRNGLITALATADTHDIIITMDSDDTHTPGLILRMVRMIREGYDVVIASRYRTESRSIGVPLFRRLLSFWASLLMRFLFPLSGVKDYTCGYRAYRVAILKKAQIKFGERLFDQDGFQCMIDILLKLRTMNLIFGEVPFVLRYDLKEGGTKMNVTTTVRKTLELLIRRRLFG